MAAYMAEPPTPRRTRCMEQLPSMSQAVQAADVEEVAQLLQGYPPSLIASALRNMGLGIGVTDVLDLQESTASCARRPWQTSAKDTCSRLSQASTRDTFALCAEKAESDACSSSYGPDSDEDDEDEEDEEEEGGDDVGGDEAAVLESCAERARCVSGLPVVSDLPSMGDLLRDNAAEELARFLLGSSADQIEAVVSGMRAGPTLEEVLRAQAGMKGA